MITTRSSGGIIGSVDSRDIQARVLNVAFLSQTEARSLHGKTEKRLADG